MTVPDQPPALLRPRRRWLLWAVLVPACWLLAVCCIGGVGAGLWYADRSAPRWQPFEVAGARVEMPAAPVPDPTGFRGTRQAYSARLKRPNQAYSIGTFPVPAGADPDRFLDESLLEFVQTVPGATERSRADDPHAGLPGRRVVVGGPGGGMACRVVLVGERAYYLAVTGEGLSSEEAGVARYLDSFALTDPEQVAKGHAEIARVKSLSEWKTRTEWADRDKKEAERKAAEAFASARYDGPPVPAASELKGLVLYLPFDEATGASSADTVSGKSLGTLAGGAKFIPGVRGSGVDVSAPGAWLDLGAAAGAFRFAPGSPFTVAGWYRVRIRYGFVLHASAAGNKERLSLLLGWEAMTALVGSNAQPGSQSRDTRLEAKLNQARADDDRWHHFALTHPGQASDGGLYMYIDGRLATPWPFSTRIDLRSVTRVQVGGTSPEMTLLPGFSGMVDELCVFDRCLSADEVKKLAGR